MQRKVIDHRYKILKKLGAGAMGEVYKAKDLKNNNIIALKLLSKKKVSSEAIQRFKREFRLLAGLHHPNLCEVYDFGTLKDGRSYFTMEYIDGQDMFTFTRKLTYEKIYPIVVQLCRVLEYIHSKGLIHYDIKPSNVLIARSKGLSQGDENSRLSDGTKGNKKVYAQSPKPYAKLLDFGLTREHRIRSGALIRGTFPYIAPEVIKGLSIDHRADLYSLGVLLYEIFARKRLKIDDETSFATFIEKKEKRSKRPLRFAVKVPKKMGQLIVRLLNIEPANRLSRANEIITVINKISRVKFAPETEKTLEGYLLSSRFVGRDKEMDLLKTSYMKAQQGNGNIVLISGDVGIGKSRLLKEFKILVQTKRGHCFTGYCHKDNVGSFEPFYDVFKELMSHIRKAPMRFWNRERKLWLAILFRVFPELTVKRLEKNLPKLVPLDSKQENLRTFNALTELITYCVSQLGELTILLEDLHWSDELSIQFLEYLGRNLGGRNILICGTSRKTELEENRVLKNLITSLSSRGYLAQVELRPFNLKNLYSFLNSTITPASNSLRLVKYFMQKTNGNPFFVEEIMRTFLRKKGVSIGEKIEIEDIRHISIPKTIENVVSKRIKDLDSVSQKVVKFGAILLKDFNYDLIKRLTGLEDTNLSEALWKLKKRQILVEKGNRHQFYHATLREAVYKRLSDKEKRGFNYQIGKTLEKINRQRLNKLVEDLAYYFINARDCKKGIKYGLLAARKSSEQYAHEQAIRFYKGVLNLLDNTNPNLQFDILSDLAYIETYLSHYDDAISYYNKALNLKKVGKIHRRVDLYLKMATLCSMRGNYVRSLYYYRKASASLANLKSSRLKNLLEMCTNSRKYMIFQILGERRDISELNIEYLKSLKNLRDKQEIKLLAHTHTNLARITIRETSNSKINNQNALYHRREALKYYEKIKDEINIGNAHIGLGFSYYVLYDFQKAIRCYQKAIRISEKIGDQYFLACAFFNLGQVLRDKGQYLEALNYFQKSTTICSRLELNSFLGHSLRGIGTCFLRLCNSEKARQYCEKSLHIYNNMAWEEQKVYPLETIGAVCQAQGKYDLAIKYHRMSLKIRKSVGPRYDMALSLAEISSIHIDIGQIPQAQRYIKNALEIATSIGTADSEIQCDIILSRLNLIIGNCVSAKNYYKRGIKLAKKFGLRLQILQLFLILSEIYYSEERFTAGIRIADKARKLATQMGTRDLSAEALLIKAKSEIKRGILSKIEILTLLNEAKKIAEEIKFPEILWKVYYGYGRFLQDDKQYFKALDYYDKCNDIFENVCKKIKNKSYQKSYLNRPDRQAVYLAKDEIAKLLH